MTESDISLKESIDILEKRYQKELKSVNSDKSQSGWRKQAIGQYIIDKWNALKPKASQKSQLDSITQSIPLLAEAILGGNQNTREMISSQISQLKDGLLDEIIPILRAQDKFWERLGQIEVKIDTFSRACPGCLAKDAHIQDLKSLLDSERRKFDEFNTNIHKRTGMLRDSNGREVSSEDDRPVRLGNLPFEELKRLAESKSRELSRNRTRESEQVEQHQKAAGATFVESAPAQSER